MTLPDEIWAHIHSYLPVKEFAWPCKISMQVRQITCFEVRCHRAKPLHGLFHNMYRYCVVEGCTASQGAFRDLIVSPYCVQNACEYHCPRVLYFRHTYNSWADMVESTA